MCSSGLHARPQELIITQTSPARSQQSYRHEALFWHDAASFTAAMVPFVTDGLAHDEPVMLALVPEHEGWMRDALPGDTPEVTFVDMSRLGANPARIIPAWQQFLDTHAVRKRPARGVGEPIWSGRRSEELLECQLHEALLNVAIDPEIPFWLVCPYDTVHLGAEVLEEAYRSHPVIVEAETYTGSARYGGRDHVDLMLGSELAALDGHPLSTEFTPDNVNRLHAYLKLELYVAGCSAERAADLAEAVQSLAQGSIRRGASSAEVRIWVQPHAVVCEVVDDTVVSDLLWGRRVPSEVDHDGVWLTNQLSDLVQTRSTPYGTTVRVYLWR